MGRQMPITVTEARQQLQRTVQEWWAETAKPILGSQLKVKLLQAIPDFREQDLGYKNFASFIRDADGIAFKFRGQADFAVVPSQFADVLEASVQEQLRIRPDLWQAFVGFSVPNQFRAYDQTKDLVIKGPPEAIPQHAIRITPIARETQLEWRREFIKSLGPESPLSGLGSALTLDGGFKEFTERLEPHPHLRRRWHVYLTHYVALAIRDWAKQIDLPDSIWLTQELTAAATPDVVRRRIYELLDAIPVDQLLNLYLPIRSLLDSPPIFRKPPPE